MPHPPLARYQALLFDLDGTLADSMGLHNEAWIGALGERGHRVTADILQEYAGIRNVRTVELFNERFGWRLDAAAVVADKEARFARNIVHVKPIAGVMGIAESCRSEKKLAVVSGGHRELVRRTLRALRAEELFPVRVCAEDTELGKPHPDPFLRAAELLAVAPARCLVFEDGEAGVRGAKAAGMGVVRVGRGPEFKLEYLG